jgi:hypothetical protein
MAAAARMRWTPFLDFVQIWPEDRMLALIEHDREREHE